GRLDEIMDAKVKYVEIIAKNVSKEMLAHMEAMGSSVYETWEQVSIKVKDENRVDGILQMIMGGKGRVVSVIPQRETLEEHFMKKTGGPS
ncbi:MAG TPA: hypothetical protein VJ024_04080, partial [Thermodesulfovibrionales bacterium]|nr:hypothetical protein [Thermodesulfovibrionales bacterium]